MRTSKGTIIVASKNKCNNPSTPKAAVRSCMRRGTSLSESIQWSDLGWKQHGWNPCTLTGITSLLLSAFGVLKLFLRKDTWRMHTTPLVICPFSVENILRERWTKLLVLTSFYNQKRRRFILWSNCKQHRPAARKVGSCTTKSISFHSRSFSSRQPRPD